MGCTSSTSSFRPHQRHRHPRRNRTIHPLATEDIDTHNSSLVTWLYNDDPYDLFVDPSISQRSYTEEPPPPYTERPENGHISVMISPPKSSSRSDTNHHQGSQSLTTSSLSLSCTLDVREREENPLEDNHLVLQQEMTDNPQANSAAVLSNPTRHSFCTYNLPPSIQNLSPSSSSLNMRQHYPLDHMPHIGSRRLAPIAVNGSSHRRRRSRSHSRRRLQRTTSAPVDVTSAPVNVTSVPADITSAPAHDATSVPVDITSAPVSVPVDITSVVPVEVASLPANITSVPVDVTSVPADVTSVPANVTSLPVDITNLPADVTSVPVEVANVPANITSVPVDITSKQSNVTSVPVYGKRQSTNHWGDTVPQEMFSTIRNH